MYFFFIKFSLNEQNLSDYLIKQGFVTHSLNPFLVETVNKYIENVDDNDSRVSPVSSSQGYVTDISNSSIHNTDWLNLVNQKISGIRQRIGRMKNDLSYANDNRIKQFQITEVCVSFVCLFLWVFFLGFSVYYISLISNCSFYYVLLWSTTNRVP